MARPAVSKWLIATILAAIALALVACGGGQVEDANAAMDAANAAVTEANTLDTEAATILEELFVLGDDELDQVPTLLDEIAAVLDKKDAAVATAKTELSGILDMDVSEDNKTYVEQQLVIIDLQADSDAKTRELLAKMGELFEAIDGDSPDEATVGALQDDIEKLIDEADALSEEIEEKSAESDAFFEEKGLGGI